MSLFDPVKREKGVKMVPQYIRLSVRTNRNLDPHIPIRLYTPQALAILHRLSVVHFTDLWQYADRLREYNKTRSALHTAAKFGRKIDRNMSLSASKTFV